ncbi:EF-hand domain-containing protein, partial [Reticulomyxa filosa]
NKEISAVKNNELNGNTINNNNNNNNSIFDDDLFADLPKEPIIPANNKASDTVGETKEWEEVTVEYESEVEEKFGQEFEQDVWYLGPDDKDKYDPLFKQADLNQDGIIDGNEAHRFFGKSKLDRQMLGQIWSVVDFEKRGHLVREQFYAMFHIILKIMKNDTKPPAVLPACLYPDIIRQIGTTVKKRVKKTKTEKKLSQKPVAQTVQPIAQPVQPIAQPLSQPSVVQPVDDFDFPGLSLYTFIFIYLFFMSHCDGSTDWDDSSQVTKEPPKPAEPTTTAPGEQLKKKKAIFPLREEKKKKNYYKKKNLYIQVVLNFFRLLFCFVCFVVTFQFLLGCLGKPPVHTTNGELVKALKLTTTLDTHTPSLVFFNIIGWVFGKNC